MAPGPNMMMIVAIGDWAGGLLGAVVVLIAFFGPTALLAFVVARLWKKLEKWPWRTSIQQGLAPVSIGLLLAGCFTMAKGAISGLETAAISVGVLLILLQCKVNPALLVVGGAVIGVLTFSVK
jgi:chromate transporter